MHSWYIAYMYYAYWMQNVALKVFKHVHLEMPILRGGGEMI